MNHRSRPVVLLPVVLLIISGCVDSASDDERKQTDPGLTITDDRPDTTFGEVETGPEAAPDLNATTAAAPRLVPGEWWRIRFTSDLFPEVPDVVRVVADVTPEGYVMGMPHSGWFKEAITFHAPAFGDVGLDLSYDTHNVRFEPIRFPLDAGATWSTYFGTTEYTATVESADVHTATVLLEPVSDPQPTDPVYGLLDPFGGDNSVRVTYDARQHEVVRWESAFATWEVLAHGYGFEGWVTVPRGMVTAIDHGVFVAAEPGDPVLSRTVAVDGGFNRLTLLHGVFAAGPGYYRITATAPGGETFVTEGHGDEPFLLAFYEASDPDGDWTIEDVVAGPGGTYSMGMAYHQYDIRLPGGEKRADHSHPVIR